MYRRPVAVVARVVVVSLVAESSVVAPAVQTTVLVSRNPTLPTTQRAPVELQFLAQYANIGDNNSIMICNFLFISVNYT